MYEISIHACIILYVTLITNSTKLNDNREMNNVLRSSGSCADVQLNLKKPGVWHSSGPAVIP